MLKHNNSLMVFLVIFLCGGTFLSSAYGLIITEPQAGSVFHAGDKVTVKAVASPDENPVAYYLFTAKMPFSAFGVFPPYELTFTIPLNFTGSDKIVASAKFSDGNIVETEIQITVVLPLNAVLTGIKVDPYPIFLYTMPTSSDPNDVRIAETDYISVSGLYSDGVKRWVASSTDGTTYTSSDETIVKVDKEGKVTAQGVGKAKITVRNGNYSATVDVIVKPYQ